MTLSLYVKNVQQTHFLLIMIYVLIVQLEQNVMGIKELYPNKDIGEVQLKKKSFMNVIISLKIVIKDFMVI